MKLSRYVLTIVWAIFLQALGSQRIPRRHYRSIFFSKFNRALPALIHSTFSVVLMAALAVSSDTVTTTKVEVKSSKSEERIDKSIDDNDGSIAALVYSSSSTGDGSSTGKDSSSHGIFAASPEINAAKEIFALSSIGGTYTFYHKSDARAFWGSDLSPPV